MDRATLAQIVHRRLRGLATDAGLSFAAVGDQPEGDYTDAIDQALRSLGLIDPETGALDISLATTDQENALISSVTGELLTQLQLHYATLVDIKAGERDEKLSQIRAAIAATSTSSTTTSGSRTVQVRSLTRRADDYVFS